MLGQEQVKMTKIEMREIEELRPWGKNFIDWHPHYLEGDNLMMKRQNKSYVIKHESVVQWVKKEIYLAKKRNNSRLDAIPPIFINKDNMIIDGHHRWIAQKELGYSNIYVTVEDLK